MNSTIKEAEKCNEAKRNRKRKEQEIQPEDEKAGLQLQKKTTCEHSLLGICYSGVSQLALGNDPGSSNTVNFYGTVACCIIMIAWLGNLYGKSSFCCTALLSAHYSWNFPFFQFIYQADWKKGSGAATASILVITLGFWWPLHCILSFLLSCGA